MPHGFRGGDATYSMASILFFIYLGKLFLFIRMAYTIQNSNFQMHVNIMDPYPSMFFIHLHR